MTASVIHFQLRAADADGLAHFYEHVLGWSVAPRTMGLDGSEVEGPSRWLESGPDGIAGGIDHDDHPAGAVVVVAVDDVAATVERALALGGRTDGPADDLWLRRQGTGADRFTYAGVVDPEGNRIGLMHRRRS
ncbi:MAG: VOC family protein [Actinomycetota bacterium]